MEMLRGKYSEGNLMCKDDNREIQQGKKFYSLDSSLVILLYFYKHQSRISAQLDVSQTRCMAVSICPCMYSMLCQKYRWELREKCQRYLSNLQNLSGLELRPGMFFRTPIVKNSCVVIQFQRSDNFAEEYLKMKSKITLSDWTSRKPPDCEMYIHTDKMMEPGHIVEYHIHGLLGSLAVYPLLTEDHLECMKSNRHRPCARESIAFAAPLAQQLWWSTHNRVQEKKGQWRLYQPSNFSKESFANFAFAALVGTPVSVDSLTLLLAGYVNTKTLIEIIISVRKKTKFSSLNIEDIYVSETLPLSPSEVYIYTQLIDRYTKLFAMCAHLCPPI